jgi:hypothetical protein
VKAATVVLTRAVKGEAAAMLLLAYARTEMSNERID